MLRGMVGDELTIHAADRDLHSGVYGGAAINPIRVLARILAGLHDARGRITLPGFYDGVPELPAAIRAQWDALDYDAGGFLGAVGLSRLAGEEGRSVFEQVWSRPTCDVNGIWGGYTGEGFKTVLPAEAHAKISFRLVGEQDPATVIESFRAYVRASLPPDCTVSFRGKEGSRAVTLPVDAPEFAAARQALSDEWANPAVFVGCGGSIPVVGHFREILGHGFAADRLRPGGRRHPFAEREVRPRELPQGRAELGAGAGGVLGQDSDASSRCSALSMRPASTPW